MPPYFLLLHLSFPDLFDLVHLYMTLLMIYLQHILTVKVGAALISFLLDSAKTDADIPAFQYSKKSMQKGPYKRVGILLLENEQYLDISGREGTNMSPRFLPMLIPPKLWENRSKNHAEGCYYRLRSSLMRTVSKSQTDALRKADMDGILSGLNYLGMYVRVDMIQRVMNATY